MRVTLYWKELPFNFINPSSQIPFDLLVTDIVRQPHIRYVRSICGHTLNWITFMAWGHSSSVEHTGACCEHCVAHTLQVRSCTLQINYCAIAGCDCNVIWLFGVANWGQQSRVSVQLIIVCVAIDCRK